MMIRVPNRLLVAAILPLTMSGCMRSPLRAQLCVRPDEQLAALLAPLQSGECRQTGAFACDRLERELERLVAVCPGHAPTLIVNAVLAYENQQPVRAQQLLDSVLSRPQGQPDAAVLRARIAIEEGNLNYARRLLDTQIRLVPDHAGLHETLAAQLYVEGKMAEAATELQLAGKLGAPRWRIAYHLGLIEESAGRADEALKLYEEVLGANPDWPTAQSRIKALRARRLKPEAGTPAEAPSPKPESAPPPSVPAAAPAPAPPAPVAAAPSPPPTTAAKAAGPAATIAEPAGTGFTIQIAALRKAEEADAIAKRLAGKGYPAYVVAPASGSVPLYRVRVGKYQERREADTVAARLQKEEQFKPWIVR